MNKYVLSRRLEQSVLLVGSRIKSSGVSSRTWGQQLRTPDSRKCCDGRKRPNCCSSGVV